MAILVIGCGRVGSGLAHELVTRRRDVTVVDVDDAAFERLGPTFPGHRLRGSGTDRGVLERAGIRHADAVAAVTGRDDVNAVIARLARGMFQVPRVVARLYDPRTADVYQRLGIRAISYVSWGVERLADLVTFAEVMPVATLGTGGVEIVEAEVPALLAGRSADELRVPGEVQVISISRHGRTFLAGPTTALEAGDLAHMAVAAASIGRLEALLGRG